MIDLYVIRHARASAAAAEYDHLHEEGLVQARLLGEHLGTLAEHFDAVFVGPHLRQRETLRIARSAASEVGAGWPEAVTIDGLAEAPYDLLVKKYLVPRLQSDATLLGLAQTLGAASDAAMRDAAMRAIWDYMVVLWSSGEIVGEDIETSQVFCARVDAALARVRGSVGDGQRVMVMTSNGVIGHILTLAAGVPPPPTEATHKLYNTSISIFELHGQRTVLRSANQVSHLRDTGLLTIL